MVYARKRNSVVTVVLISIAIFPILRQYGIVLDCLIVSLVVSLVNYYRWSALEDCYGASQWSSPVLAGGLYHTNL